MARDATADGSVSRLVGDAPPERPERETMATDLPTLKDLNNRPSPKEEAAIRSAMRAELNRLILKLREAGVPFYGHYQWRLLEAYWNPTGFDFWCDDWKRLQDTVRKSKKFAEDHSDMPGGDPWKRVNLIAAGFSRVGATPRIHLDFAVNRPGLCRIYLQQKGPDLKRGWAGQAQITTARNSDVYKKVVERLKRLSPPLLIEEHIGGNLTAGHSTLDGISFVAKDPEALKKALVDAKDSGGKPAFAVGSKADPRDWEEQWALTASFGATVGTGFREIWRPPANLRPLLNEILQAREDWDRRQFSAHFGDAIDSLDLSSLHCAVSPFGCNIHIDDMGFVMEDASGKPIVIGNFLRHLLIELLWKTMLQKKLPQWALDRINFEVPSSPFDFSRAGVGIDLVQRKNLKVTLRGSCATTGGFACSGTLTIGGRHDVAGSR